MELDQCRRPIVNVFVVAAVQKKAAAPTVMKAHYLWLMIMTDCVMNY